MSDRQMTWDELCTEMVEAQRARDEWEKTAQTAIALNDSLVKSIEKVTKERDEAEAKCAEMREVLHRIDKDGYIPNAQLDDNHPAIKHALSFDCGKKKEDL